MEKLTIKTSTNTYPIIIGKDVRKHLKEYISKDYSSIFIITDENVAEHYLSDIRSALDGKQFHEKILPAGENTKSIEWYTEIQTEAIKNGLDRNSLIIALGGGVVGDLAGLVAATFMRGIDYIQMPTTILAHDSSVGGKVAINHPLGKNLIGAFYPPASVIYDVATLTTLPISEIRSGYAEIIKEGLIANERLFEDILKKDLSFRTQEELANDLLQAIKVKADIVEADEKEQGIRSYLNLGHTFAHALEAELGYGKITHGEAVAIGLLFAIHVSESVFSVDLPFVNLKDWLNNNNYPIHAFDYDSKRILNKMKADKKTINQQIKMVLLKAPEKLINYELSDAELIDHLEIFKERLVLK
ncbi:3-dehydroquinate synthase [Oceanobacillus sp. CAU 1775]